MNLNTVNILDKEKADILSAKGFKYTAQRINDSQSVYVFYASDELMKELHGQFDKQDYFISKTICL